MERQRIYAEKVSIDTDKVKAFYSSQVKKAENKIGAVLLGEQSEAVLEAKNAWSRDYILPMLGVGPHTRVLDLGCGIGRAARFLLPGCGFYCGVDFSEEMIREAEHTCRRQGGAFRLYCAPIAEAAAKDAAFFGGKFDLVILAGVLTYLNDAEAEQVFRHLPNLLAAHSTVYSQEPVGIGKRLTLKDFPSEALHAAYSAIYRTPEEYEALFAPLTDNGFSIIKMEFLPRFGERYTDTGRHFTILRR